MSFFGVSHGGTEDTEAGSSNVGAFARGLEMNVKLLGSAVCQQWGRPVSPPSAKKLVGK